MLCSYRCNTRLEFVKHSFSCHSVEATFHFVCGIQGCVHSFKFGWRFSSFKSHASRKHKNWQECNVSTSAETVTLDYPTLPLEPLPHFSPVTSSPLSVAIPVNHADCSLPLSLPLSGMSAHCNESSSFRAQRTAASFLLTFKEQYKLPQTVINFAIGAINGLITDVSEAVRESPTSEYENPFASLQTEYKQSKFYREVFGLVVSMTIYNGRTCIIWLWHRNLLLLSLVQHTATEEAVLSALSLTNLNRFSMYLLLRILNGYYKTKTYMRR